MITLYDNEYFKWSHGIEDYTLHIQSDNVESPLEDNNPATMAIWWNGYQLGNDTGAVSPTDYWRDLVIRQPALYDKVFDMALNGKLNEHRVNSGENGTFNISIRYGDEELEVAASSSRMGILDYILEDLTVVECMQVLKDEFVWLPLYVYEHGGITISCTEFADRFDSGPAGWIVSCKKDAVEFFGTENNWKERTYEFMRDLVKRYNQWLNGDVYRYTIYDSHDMIVDDYNGVYDVESLLQLTEDYGLCEALDAGTVKIGTAKEHTVTRYTYE